MTLLTAQGAPLHSCWFSAFPGTNNPSEMAYMQRMHRCSGLGNVWARKEAPRNIAVCVGKRWAMPPRAAAWPEWGLNMLDE